MEETVEALIQLPHVLGPRGRRHAFQRRRVPGDRRLDVAQVRRSLGTDSLGVQGVSFEGVNAMVVVVDAAPVARDGVPAGDEVDAVLVSHGGLQKFRKAVGAAELRRVRRRRPGEAPRKVGVLVEEQHQGASQGTAVGRRKAPEADRKRIVRRRLDVRRVELADGRRDGLLNREGRQAGEPRHDGIDDDDVIVIHGSELVGCAGVVLVVEMRRDDVFRHGQPRQRLAGHESGAFVVDRRRGRFAVELHPAVVDDEALALDAVASKGP
mmetsp:Transcript_22073/g.71063  ORF Transcript_22073/g.71063 Transcript_22073/m.71063 type:complete len:267 (-) Transcript_22073:923-1723(-)